MTGGRVLVAAALVAAVPIVLGTPRPSAAATGRTMVAVLNGAPASLPPGARVVGIASPGASIELDVALNVRDPAELQAMLAGVYNRRSPLFHHFLVRGQFARLFGATSGELASIEAWLRSAGLSPTGVAANRLTIHAKGTLGNAARALQTSFSAVRAPGGQLDFINRAAPSVPAGIAGDVQGIIGLNDLPAVHDDLARATQGHVVASRAADPRVTGPAACTSLAQAASGQGSFTAGGLASYYAMAPLYALGDDGQGVHVAIAEFEPDLRSDVAWFEHCYKATNVVNYVHIDGGQTMGPGPGSGESALDIENVISLAPRATIDVYQTPNTDPGATDMYAKMVSTDVDKVITTSWGSCEPHTDSPVIDSEETTFAQANLQGQVVFAAAGDSGSTDCYGDEIPSDQSTLEVDDPGSQPYVLSVGGTSAAAHAEVVWNSDGSAGGGGISQLHCMPSYQDNVSVPDLINVDSVTDATMCPSGYWRQVPDVTAIADPNTGYTIYYDGGISSIGGTSGAAPLWAAAAALVLASPYCSYDHASVGVTPQSLYAFAATATYGRGLRDITSGNNVVAGSEYAGNLYPALAGYDEASGLGSPMLTASSKSLLTALFQPGLASLLCHAEGSVPADPVVASVAPRVAASTAPTTLTVRGTGFFPIEGAVRVVFDRRSFPATCTTSTRCTVIVNHLTPGSTDVRVYDQTYAESTATTADKVTVLASPTVTSLSPRTGPTRGLTRVTIRGKGFTGTVSVHFGTKAATKVTVVSGTKVVVTAPAGKGSVYVEVTATGGVSARSPAGLYHY